MSDFKLIQGKDLPPVGVSVLARFEYKWCFGPDKPQEDWGIITRQPTIEPAYDLVWDLARAYEITKIISWYYVRNVRDIEDMNRMV